MASEERIEQLKQYCEDWKEGQKIASERRDQLIKWQEMGMRITSSDSEGDIFPDLIKEADDAARLYQKILIRMESLRDRAINGEDV